MGTHYATGVCIQNSNQTGINSYCLEGKGGGYIIKPCLAVANTNNIRTWYVYSRSLHATCSFVLASLTQLPHIQTCAAVIHTHRCGHTIYCLLCGTRWQKLVLKLFATRLVWFHCKREGTVPAGEAELPLYFPPNRPIIGMTFRGGSTPSRACAEKNLNSTVCVL